MEKTYSEKLKDPRWQKKRLEILERDKWECQHCGNKEITLHVHHTYYKPKCEPWETKDECLITLCENCHDTEKEDFDAKIHDLVLMIRQSGITSQGLDPVIYYLRKNFLSV